MSSTALTWHIGMKTAFITNISKAIIFLLIEENAYLKKYSTIQQGSPKIQLSATPIIFANWSKMLSSS